MFTEGQFNEQPVAEPSKEKLAAEWEDISRQIEALMPALNQRLEKAGERIVLFKSRQYSLLATNLSRAIARIEPKLPDAKIEELRKQIKFWEEGPFDQTGHMHREAKEQLKALLENPSEAVNELRSILEEAKKISLLVDRSWQIRNFETYQKQAAIAEENKGKAEEAPKKLESWLESKRKAEGKAHSGNWALVYHSEQKRHQVTKRNPDLSQQEGDIGEDEIVEESEKL